MVPSLISTSMNLIKLFSKLIFSDIIENSFDVFGVKSFAFSFG
jgi:hypothetical protein